MHCFYVTGGTALDRVQYSTWAGMIVTQYGRIESVSARLEAGPPGASSMRAFSPSASPPHGASAALHQLHRYYGTGETASEPGDFKPGAQQACVSLKPGMSVPVLHCLAAGHARPCPPSR